MSDCLLSFLDEIFEVLAVDHQLVVSESLRRYISSHPEMTLGSCDCIRLVVLDPEQDPATDPYGGNGDTYIFRLAETYLLRAEAHFWNGNLAEAANDLNEVRQRAGALPASAGDVDIDFIFDERARELFTEAPRHSELVRASYIMARNNINGYSMENFSNNNWFYDRVMEKNVFFQINFTWGAQSYRISPHNVLWPIPETVITENTQGVINQNEGYTGVSRNAPPLETID